MHALLLLCAATWAAPPGAPGVSIPLHALSAACQDARYPALAGPWAIGCGKTGQVDRAISLHTGQMIRLPASDSPGLTEGAVYAPEQGRIDLTRPTTAKVSSFERSRFSERTAPPAIAQAGIAVLMKDTVNMLATGQGVIRKIQSPAPPLGFQPPAVAGDQVAWAVNAGKEGSDLWHVPIGGGAPQLLAGGPGDQHHVTAQAHWLAWVAPEGVVILDTQSGQQIQHPASTGFSAGLTLWNGVACWETREGPDVDIACSDGTTVGGDGHQVYPSRWERWLMYRVQGTVFLHTLDTP